MTAHGTSRAAEPSPARVEGDQRVYLHGVSWEDYRRIAALRGESAVPRLTYLEGVLELMSPGTKHEWDKKTLARLFEAYLELLGVEADGIGSWTVKRKKKKSGAEPDECYVFPPIPPLDELERPDLVIEVVYSSGGLDKLEVWRRLGAKEVWFWGRPRGLEIFVRRADGFERAERSAHVPGIDPALLARCMDEPTQGAAVKALRAGLAPTP
jgi:Uma2 family endonuclease